MPDELSRKQQEDPNLSNLHEWIDKGSKPDREEAASYSQATRKLWLYLENIQRVDGILYQKWFKHSGNTYKLQLVVPSSLIPDVLQQCHNTVFAARVPRDS